MALMDWKDSFSVGVKAMDEQHKVLVKALNDLHSAMATGQTKIVTGPLLAGLARYTRDHFTTEEALLKRNSYPGLTGHQGKHLDLNRQVEAFVARFERGELTLNVHLFNFLREWLSSHIQKEDREYGKWLNEKGIR